VCVRVFFFLFFGLHFEGFLTVLHTDVHTIRFLNIYIYALYLSIYRFN